jgi:hypothetical protein
MSQATLSGARVEHPIGPAGRFHLRIVDGHARLCGVPGDRVVVEERNGRDIAREFLVEPGDGSLEIRVRARHFGLSLGSRTRPDFDIQVPAGATVVVETVNGQIDGEGLRGAQRYRTASGDLVFTGAAGDLTVDAVSGGTRIDAIDSVVLTARTVSGALRLAAPLILGASIGTTSGRIALDGRLSPGGAYSVQTVNGDAEITTDAGVTIEARTVTGSIRTEPRGRSEGGPGRRQVILGDGRAHIAFRSISGDLTMTVPEGGTGRPPATGEAESEATATARLGILQALERGEIDVDEASARLTDLEGDTR